MNVDGLDLIALSKLITQQVEQVTCLECCKYYIAPETATCGHTLCHACWKGRHTCPTCATPFDRKALKLNLPLQQLTEHVHVLADLFESKYHIKLDEFDLEVVEKMEANDPSKHVKDWLASSENHFSAPLTSQQSVQDIVPLVELSSSKIQIHSHTKKIQSPVKVACAPQPQQDWDKIEILPDTEEIRNAKNDKDKIAQIMDIEPFHSDNEYTTSNPRRSSRNREARPDLIPRQQDTGGDKYSSKNSSIDTEKHLLKTKQNWNSVKKMRKEFSRLGKRDRSKLNVSIEMCKKAQSKSKSQSKTPPVTTEHPVYNINDDTPDITKDTNKKRLKVTDKKIFNTDSESSRKKSVKELDTKTVNPKSSDGSGTKKSSELTSMEVDESLEKGKKNTPKESQNKSNINKQSNDSKTAKNSEPNGSIMEIDNQNTNIEKLATPDLVIHKPTPLNVRNTDTTNKDKLLKLPFIKKSNLHVAQQEKHNVEITQKELVSNRTTENTDDIEISIRIGTTVTNIVIKQKPHNVQMKLNTDQEIQTSLGPYTLNERHDAACSPVKAMSVRNIELNIGEGNKIEAVEVKEAGEANKSHSTKKHTASADTASAQFEITDSVERELSNVMECVVRGSKNSQKTISKSIQKPTSQAVMEESEISKENNIPEDMADLQDLDIFNSGSVKEPDVQLLKNTKSAASEILVPSNKNKKSQKHPDKRDRDMIDENEEMPQNKKPKIDTQQVENEVPTEEKTNDVKEIPEQDKPTSPDHDIDPMNYDAILGQAFANIDADIQDSQKNAPHDVSIIEVQNTKPSQVIKTQKTLSRKKTSVIEVQNESVKDIEVQKYSENMFSMMDKNSESVNEGNEKADNQVPEENTVEENVKELLTPGLCKDLVATREEPADMDICEQEFGTPIVVHDDDDVVEETPQKNFSFAKPKQKSELTIKPLTQCSQTNTNIKMLSQVEKQMSDSQIIKSIISISDSEMETSKCKEITVVENNKQLETPLSINKFFNYIKHNSTPVARKSLNFESQKSDDPEKTLCPTTTQEKEFMEKAFEQTQNTPKRPLGLKTVRTLQTKQLCVAGSCLSALELASLKGLCRDRGWTFTDKYTDDLTHLVVGVDSEKRSQRSVKYMCALAAGKFIVTYKWVERCLQTKSVVDESPYEALDAGGEPGPRKSRLATAKLFDGFTFHCMPPFSILDVRTLKAILEAAGARVVESIADVRISDDDEDHEYPKILLAEPESTQEDRFIFIAIEHHIVPVNYEWVLNSLGNYTLCSIKELLLCPVNLLPKCITSWPTSMMQSDDDVDDE